MNNKNIVYSSTYTEKTSSHRVNMDSFSETTIPSIMIDSHILPGESTFPPMEESHMPEKKKIPPTSTQLHIRPLLSSSISKHKYNQHAKKFTVNCIKHLCVQFMNELPQKSRSPIPMEIIRDVVNSLS